MKRPRFHSPTIADRLRAALAPRALQDPEYQVAVEVVAEVLANRARWGVQDYVDVGGWHDPADVRRIYELNRDVWQGRNADRLAEASGQPHMNRPAGPVGWDGVLLEEMFEALAEEDPARIRAELVQVAAVAQQWIAAIDRRPVTA